jgi:hypothetical protein
MICGCQDYEPEELICPECGGLPDDDTGPHEEWCPKATVVNRTPRHPVASIPDAAPGILEIQPARTSNQ